MYSEHGGKQRFRKYVSFNTLWRGSMKSTEMKDQEAEDRMGT